MRQPAAGWVHEVASQMRRRLGILVFLVLVIAAGGCVPVPAAMRGVDACARAMSLQPVDAGWLAEQAPYEELYRTMVEARSSQLRRSMEAITTCYQPGDEIWLWRRSVWLSADANEFVAGVETGYALVRNGASVGGVSVGQQQTGGRVR